MRGKDQPKAVDKHMIGHTLLVQTIELRHQVISPVPVHLEGQYVLHPHRQRGPEGCSRGLGFELRSTERCLGGPQQRCGPRLQAGVLVAVVALVPIGVSNEFTRVCLNGNARMATVVNHKHSAGINRVIGSLERGGETAAKHERCDHCEAGKRQAHDCQASGPQTPAPASPCGGHGAIVAPGVTTGRVIVLAHNHRGDTALRAKSGAGLWARQRGGNCPGPFTPGHLHQDDVGL